MCVQAQRVQVLPETLSEVFAQMFAFKFPSAAAFERVTPLLNVCLASLRPPTASDLHHALSSAHLHSDVTQEDFTHRLTSLAPFLWRRSGGGFVLAHSALRAWLMRRDDGDRSFLCDAKYEPLSTLTS